MTGTDDSADVESSGNAAGAPEIVNLETSMDRLVNMCTSGTEYGSPTKVFGKPVVSRLQRKFQPPTQRIGG
jgi:hypothetical protein